MKKQTKIEQFYRELELELIGKIGELINYQRAYQYQDRIDEWKRIQVDLLTDLKSYRRKHIQHYLTAMDKDLQEWLDELYSKALHEVDEGYKPFIEAGALTYTAHVRQKQFIDTLLGEMIRDNRLIVSGIIQNLDKVYIDIVNESARMAIMGDKTLRQSAVMMMKKWAEKGMPVIQDRRGRNLSIEGYSAMTMRATQKNVANHITEQRLNEYDIDLIEFSSHISSRPTHAPFQGRIYDRKGTHPKYPPLSSTSYGEPLQGMVTGINCRHHIYPFMEGVSVQKYKPYDPEKVDRAYRKEQAQRQLERNIRASKKVVHALKSMEAPQDEIMGAELKVKQGQKIIREFIKNTGRTRRYDREQIAV